MVLFPLPSCRHDILTPPWAQHYARPPHLSILLHTWPTTLSCLPLATESLAVAAILPKLSSRLSSLPSSSPHLKVTVDSLLIAKPGLFATAPKPAMQTLSTLFIRRTARRIPWVFPIRLRIDPNVLQQVPFRLQTPIALRKPSYTPRVAEEARMTLPVEPMTSRVKPSGLKIVYRVWIAIERDSRATSRTATPPPTCSLFPPS